VECTLAGSFEPVAGIGAEYRELKTRIGALRTQLAEAQTADELRQADAKLKELRSRIRAARAHAAAFASAGREGLKPIGALGPALSKMSAALDGVVALTPENMRWPPFIGRQLLETVDAEINAAFGYSAPGKLAAFIKELRGDMQTQIAEM